MYVIHLIILLNILGIMIDNKRFVSCILFIPNVEAYLFHIILSNYQVTILFSGHPGISVNKLSPLSLRRWNIRHFTFDVHRLKMTDSLLLEEVTSPRKREYLYNTGIFIPLPVLWTILVFQYCGRQSQLIFLFTHFIISNFHLSMK